MRKDIGVGYFPPLGQPVRGRIRQTVKAATDEAEAHARVAALCEETAQLTPFSTTFTETEAVVRQAGRDIHFPRLIPPVKFVLIAYGYVEWLKRKYSEPGFCEVAPGDIVFDCGAYVGGFAMGVADIAQAVYGFEPAPGNFDCFRKNAAQFGNIHPLAMGLGRKNDVLDLNISHSSVEHSFLTPDRGSAAATVSVDVRTVADVMASQSLTRIDFFKIEAEGFEIEVFEGLGTVRPRKIAIDISPERDRASPGAYFEKALSERGYEVRRRKNVLFGVLG